VVEKGIEQAYRIQQRLRIWRLRRAAVLGSGTLGLLGTLVLRLEVVTMGRTRPPFLNAQLLEEIGARYLSSQDFSLEQASGKYGPFDLILEGTGVSALVFEAMEVLAKNGVLVMLSITGGGHKVEIPADRINLGFVLGNKVAVGSVNANREYFELGAKELAQAELEYPGWLAKLLTHPIRGPENYQDLLRPLTEAKVAIKVFCEVAAVEALSYSAAG
jgi:threonine dehydrogenase-like Zn-dependent dehydrogenase